MGALAKAAENVNKAWCKNDLRAEKEARDHGDSYCAVGALAAALIPDGTLLSLDGEQFGPEALIYELDKIELKAITDDDYTYSDEDYDALQEIRSQLDHTYTFTAKTDEIKVLAEVIRANFPDRVEDVLEEDYVDDETLDFYNSTVYTFNDHDDTKREEVVAMMEKADRLLEDRELEAAFAEDKTADELVAEIDTLLSV